MTLHGKYTNNSFYKPEKNLNASEDNTKNCQSKVLFFKPINSKTQQIKSTIKMVMVMVIIIP